MSLIDAIGFKTLNMPWKMSYFNRTLSLTVKITYNKAVVMQITLIVANARLQAAITDIVVRLTYYFLKQNPQLDNLNSELIICA